MVSRSSAAVLVVGVAGGRSTEPQHHEYERSYTYYDDRDGVVNSSSMLEASRLGASSPVTKRNGMRRSARAFVLLLLLRPAITEVTISRDPVAN